MSSSDASQCAVSFTSSPQLPVFSLAQSPASARDFESESRPLVHLMPYYDEIRSKTIFSKQALAEKMKSFESLYGTKDFGGGVSRWGRKHLFASRVLCRKPQRRLSLRRWRAIPRRSRSQRSLHWPSDCGSADWLCQYVGAPDCSAM